MTSDADTRSNLLARAAAHAERYLSTIHERHAGARASGDELRRLLRSTLTENGEDGGTVLDELARAAQDGTTASQGRATSGSSPAGACRSRPAPTGSYPPGIRTRRPT